MSQLDLFSSSGLRQAFERLGYAIAPRPLLAMRPWALDGEVEGAALTLLGGAPADRGFQLVLLVASEPFGGAPADWARRWAARLWRRHRAFRGLLLVAPPDHAQLVIAALHPDGDPDRPGVHLLHLRRGEVRPVELERLDRLAVGPEESAEALTCRLRRELDLQTITSRFFQSFKAVHAMLAASFEGFSAPVGQGERALLATLTLNRLIFLYFLQRKGLLAGQSDFITRRLLRHQAERAAAPGGPSLYRGLLRPLFFSALNLPLHRRPERVVGLGPLPYLNGGLFEPSPLERLHAELDLPDAALLPAFEGLFERFAFTTRDDGAGVGIDPEALGRVFEALMAAEERAATGAFYTPRPLAQELFRHALRVWLQGEGVGGALADALLAAPGPPPPLPAALARALLERLAQLTVLDPACGSGALLLVALHGIEALTARLYAALDRPQPDLAALRRQIVTRNLHGIDINPTAVHICTLRLWLAVVDAEPSGVDIQPLPNLDHRVRCGDALLSPLQTALHAEDLAILRGHAAHLSQLKERYAHATTDDKASTRAQLLDAEGDLFGALIQARLRRVEAEQESLDAALEQPTLLPGVVPSPRRELLRQRERLQETRANLLGLQSGAAAPPFDPTLHAAEVFQRGGFDLIVGNPPWVRLRAIPADTRALLRRHYRTLREPAWLPPGVSASARGFATQADLATCFVERALQLLKPGGTAALLLPAKLTRALYAAPLRRLLLQEADLHVIQEYDPRHFPDANTYPCALVASRGGDSPRADAVAVVTPHHPPYATPPRSLPFIPGDLGAPWVLVPGPVLDPTLPPLATCAHLTPRRGVMTGLNVAFLRPLDAPAAHTALALTGADILPFTAHPSQRLLFPHGPDLAPLALLPDPLHDALAPHRERLQARTDLRRGDPWWRLFRISPELLTPRVVWRDIATRLEAAAHGPTLDGAPLIPLNTAYYIPTPTLDLALLLAAWLNATPTRRAALALAEPAADGYARFFAWVIAALPLPLALANPHAAADPALAPLLALSRHLHAHPEEAEAAQGELDALVLALATPRCNARRSA